jgi:hypothetical protein
MCFDHCLPFHEDLKNPQRRLGDVHFESGQYQSGTEHLKAAVEAYKAPLQHLWTREFLPLEWAV